MQGKELHDFLFRLYDYADQLADEIQVGGDRVANSNNFLMLVMIEKFFDRVGRSQIHQAASEAEDLGLNASESLSEAHRRIDLLRSKIYHLYHQHDFSEVLDGVSRQFATEWRHKN